MVHMGKAGLRGGHDSRRPVSELLTQQTLSPTWCWGNTSMPGEADTSECITSPLPGPAPCYSLTEPPEPQL